MVAELFNDTTNRIVRNAVKRSAKAQRFFLDEDDLQQEAYLYMLENKAKVLEWVEYGRQGLNLLGHALYQHLHQVTMRERYLKDGTKPEDYYQYRREVIIELLAEMFDDEPMAVPSTSDLNAVIRAPKQPSEGGDRMAMLADMQYAYSRISDYDKAVLADRYKDGGLPVEAMAATRDLPARTMQSHIDRALRAMAKQVGGEPPRTRRAMSNMEAQMITREQENQ